MFWEESIVGTKVPKRIATRDESHGREREGRGTRTVGGGRVDAEVPEEADGHHGDQRHEEPLDLMGAHLGEVDEHEGHEIEASEERPEPEREAEENLDGDGGGNDPLDIAGNDGDLCGDPQEKGHGGGILFPEGRRGMS
jgi:hypothetical protein